MCYAYFSSHFLLLVFAITVCTLGYFRDPEVQLHSLPSVRSILRDHPLLRPSALYFASKFPDFVRLCSYSTEQDIFLLLSSALACGSHPVRPTTNDQLRGLFQAATFISSFDQTLSSFQYLETFMKEDDDLLAWHRLECVALKLWKEGEDMLLKEIEDDNEGGKTLASPTFVEQNENREGGSVIGPRLGGVAESSGERSEAGNVEDSEEAERSEREGSGAGNVQKPEINLTSEDRYELASVIKLTWFIALRLAAQRADTSLKQPPQKCELLVQCTSHRLLSATLVRLIYFPLKVGQKKSEDHRYGSQTVLYVPIHERERFLDCFNSTIALKILTDAGVPSRYTDPNTKKSKNLPKSERIKQLLKLPMTPGGYYQHGASTDPDAKMVDAEASSFPSLDATSSSTSNIIPSPSIVMPSAIVSTKPDPNQPMLSSTIKSMLELNDNDHDGTLHEVFLGRFLNYIRSAGDPALSKVYLEEPIIAIASCPIPELKRLFKSFVHIDNGTQRLVLVCLQQLDVQPDHFEDCLASTVKVTSANLKDLSIEIKKLLTRPGTYAGVLHTSDEVERGHYAGVGAGRLGPLGRMKDHIDITHAQAQAINQKWAPAKDQQVWYHTSTVPVHDPRALLQSCPASVAIIKAAKIGHTHLYTSDFQLLQFSQFLFEMLLMLAFGGQARLNRFKALHNIDIWRSTSSRLETGSNGGEGYAQGGNNLGKGDARESEDMINIFDASQGVKVLPQFLVADHTNTRQYSYHGQDKSWCLDYYSQQGRQSLGIKDTERDAQHKESARLYVVLQSSPKTQDSYYRYNPPAGLYPLPTTLKSWNDLRIYVVRSDKDGTKLPAYPLYRRSATGNHMNQFVEWVLRSYEKVQNKSSG